MKGLFFNILAMSCTTTKENVLRYFKPFFEFAQKKYSAIFYNYRIVVNNIKTSECPIVSAYSTGSCKGKQIFTIQFSFLKQCIHKMRKK